MGGGDIQSAEALLALVSGLRPGRAKGVRAPHKPLLLLYALGRLQRGESRLVRFEEAEAPLKALLSSFGTATQTDPRLPFWHLKSDGLWEVAETEGLALVRGGKRPRLDALRAHGRGGIPTPLYALLKEEPSLVRQVAERLLAEHFPESYQFDVLEAVCLTIDAVQVQRDPTFRGKVLRAYGYRCGVCGIDPHLDGLVTGLEAAHVRWHKHGGPGSVDNGIAMCPLHHKFFDLGLIGLSDDRRFVVSSRLHGGGRVEEYVGRFHGRALVVPDHHREPVALRHVQWHFRQVFKGPARRG